MVLVKIFNIWAALSPDTPKASAQAFGFLTPSFNLSEKFPA